MTETLQEEVFAKHQWIAWDVARKIAQQYERPYDEVKDTAEFALVMELFDRRKHNPKKSSLSNWLWRVVYWYLKEVYTRGRHPRNPQLREFRHGEVPFTDCISHEGSRITDLSSLGMGLTGSRFFTTEFNPPAKTTWLDKLLKEISEEAGVLVSTIVEAPAEIADELIPRRRGRPSNKRRRAAVRAYLIDTLDWDWNKFNRAWREVEMSLAG